MDGVETRTAFCELVGKQLQRESFTLIDVGCSLGIDLAWRSFGTSLRAFAFDPNIVECRRLAAHESNPNVRYYPAFVGIPPDHPFALKKGDRPHTARNPWGRLSAARSLEIVSRNIDTLSNRARTDLNLWPTTELADADHPVYLLKFLEENNVDQVDFIKIDVDGADFDILASLDSSFNRLAVLGLGLEVNYLGSECETDHTFHNTDRYLRSHGFDLFGLTVRRYSNQSLPSRYRGQSPGSTEYGRPLQGDALYLRDVCSADAGPVADGLSGEKLAKLAAIFSLFRLPDCAAEVLLRFEGKLSPILNTGAGLEVLTEQAQMGSGLRLSYGQYISAFEANDSMFYPSRRSPTLDLRRLVRKGVRLAREQVLPRLTSGR
jgi:FkbM family methyltransferase